METGSKLPVQGNVKQDYVGTRFVLFFDFEAKIFHFMDVSCNLLGLLLFIFVWFLFIYYLCSEYNISFFLRNGDVNKRCG